MGKMKKVEQSETDYMTDVLKRLRPEILKELNGKIHKFKMENADDPKVIIMNKNIFIFSIISLKGLYFFSGYPVYFSNAVDRIEVF